VLQNVRVTFAGVLNGQGSYSRCYGVATISRLLKSIGLFCKRALSKRRYSAKETCNSKEPTNRSHPICIGETTKEKECMCAPTRESDQRDNVRACVRASVCVCV